MYMSGARWINRRQLMSLQFETQLRHAVPAGRAGTPVEIADLVSFLLSSKATYITGQDIVVDGGLIIQEPFNLLRHSTS